MRNFNKWLVLALCVVAPALMAPTGGFPSRPRFQSVGINTAVPAAAGDFAISGSMTGGTVPDARLTSNVPLKNAANTFTSANIFSPTLAAGTWSAQSVGASGAARDIFLAGQTGFSNGFTVQFNGTQMQYAFSSGNVVIGAPASGTPLTVTGIAATATIGVNHIGTTTAAMFDQFANTSGSLWVGVENSAGAALFSGTTSYAGVIGTTNATPFCIGTNATARMCVTTTGTVQVNGVPINQFAAYKTSNTLRTTTTTFADDPELILTSVPAGTYVIEATIYLQCNATTTQGIKMQFAYGGTIVSGRSNYAVNINATSSQGSNGSLDPIGTVTFANCGSVGADVAKLSASVVLSTTGNISLQWAQNSSSANDTRVLISSTLNARRIG